MSDKNTKEMSVEEKEVWGQKIKHELDENCKQLEFNSSTIIRNEEVNKKASEIYSRMINDRIRDLSYYFALKLTMLFFEDVYPFTKLHDYDSFVEQAKDTVAYFSDSVQIYMLHEIANTEKYGIDKEIDLNEIYKEISTIDKFADKYHDLEIELMKKRVDYYNNEIENSKISKEEE